MAVVRDYVWNLPHEYYPAIGEFIFRFGQFEIMLHEILWRAIGIGNREGRVLTIGTDIKVIRAMLRNVTSDEMRGHWIPKNRKDLVQGINGIAGKIREPLRFRNKLAHGSWQSPVRGDRSDVQLLFMKEFNEKYLANVDKNINDAFIHKEAAKLKALNLQAYKLLIELNAFRGVPPSAYHGLKNFR